MKKTEAQEFLKQSPEDFQERCKRLATPFNEMVSSEAYALLLEFQNVMTSGYLNALEVADTYEEFLKAKANLDAIKRMKMAPITLSQIIKDGLAQPSTEGTSPDGSLGY